MSVGGRAKNTLAPNSRTISFVRSTLPVNTTTLPEGSAAEVVNNQVMRHGQLNAGPPRPLGEIIVIEHTGAKPLIEPADRLVDSSFHQQR